MDRIGRYSLITGLVLTLIGLVFGFGLMFAGQDDWAKFFLMIVPFGFLVLFAGLSTVVLFAPRDSGK